MMSGRLYVKAVLVHAYINGHGQNSDIHYPTLCFQIAVVKCMLVIQTYFSKGIKYKRDKGIRLEGKHQRDEKKHHKGCIVRQNIRGNNI